jgi:hypothetical protein
MYMGTREEDIPQWNPVRSLPIRRQTTELMMGAERKNPVPTRDKSPQAMTEDFLPKELAAQADAEEPIIAPIRKVDTTVDHRRSSCVFVTTLPPWTKDSLQKEVRIF